MQRTLIRLLATISAALVLVVLGIATEAQYEQDDFGWINLRARQLQGESMGSLLFTPMAQGTVRTLSERLPFLLSATYFGLDAAPMRWLHFTVSLLMLLSWYALLVRGGIDPSRSVIALSAWFLTPALLKGHLWSSALNQPFHGLTIALALLSFPLSGWLYLAVLTVSLLVHEMAVAIPLYVLLAGGTSVLRSWPWRLSVAASAAWCVYIVRSAQTVGHTHYALSSRWETMVTNWAAYARMVLGASLLEQIPMVLLLAMTLYLSVRSKLWLGLGMMSTLGVFLTLSGMQNGYYLFIPMLGLMVCVAQSWQKASTAYFVLLALVIAPRFGALLRSANDFVAETQSVRLITRGVENELKKSADGKVLVAGINNRQYSLGLSDDPFRIFGERRVYFVESVPHELFNAFQGYWIYTRFLDIPTAKAVAAKNLAAVVNGRGESMQPSQVLRMLPKGWNGGALVRRPGHAFDLASGLDSGFGEFASGLRWMDRKFRIGFAGSSSTVMVSLFAEGDAGCGLRIESGEVKPLRGGYEQYQFENVNPSTALQFEVHGNCRVAIDEVILPAHEVVVGSGNVEQQIHGDRKRVQRNMPAAVFASGQAGEHE